MKIILKKCVKLMEIFYFPFLIFFYIHLFDGLKIDGFFSMGWCRKIDYVIFSKVRNVLNLSYLFVFYWKHSRMTRKCKFELTRNLSMLPLIYFYFAVFSFFFFIQIFFFKVQASSRATVMWLFLWIANRFFSLEMWDLVREWSFFWNLSLDLSQPGFATNRGFKLKPHI